MSKNPQGNLVTLVLKGEDGRELCINVDTTLGKAGWLGDGADVQRIVHDTQCAFRRTGKNEWVVQPDSRARNQTLLNGEPLVGAEVLKDGDALAVGNKAKRIVKAPITVRLVLPESIEKEPEHEPAESPDSDAPASDPPASAEDAPAIETPEDPAATGVAAEAPPEERDADPSKSLEEDERVRVRDFVNDILHPIFRDGQIDFPEETPAAIALIAYGVGALIDSKKEAVVHQIVETLGEGEPTETRPMKDVWEFRLFPYVMRLTQAELRATHDWLVYEARERGQDYSFPLVPGGMHGRLLRKQGTGTFTADSKQSLLAFCHEVLEHVTAELEADTQEPEPAEEGGLVVAKAVREEQPELAEQPEPEPEPEPIEELYIVGVEHLVVPVEKLEQVKEKLESGAEAIIARMEEALSEGNRPTLAFEEFREGAETKAVFVDPSGFDPEQHNLWFLGDVHGDFLALQYALAYITKFEPDKPPYIVFLGDIIDRGQDSFAAALLLFELIRLLPGRVALLLGNHDEGLMWKEDLSEYGSTVMPSEFVDWLNNPPEEYRPVAERLGKTLIKLCDYAPAALFMPGGTFAAHGGMPHCDLHDAITDRASLNSVDCTQDFIWTRVSRNSKHKEPNRLTRGCEFGYEDFYAFCKLVTERLDFPVKRMVRGHDHIEDRYQLHKRCNDYRMLTINNVSHRMEGEYFWNGGYVRSPCLARYVPDGLPEAHILQIPEDVVAGFYPEPIPEPDPEPEEEPVESESPEADGPEATPDAPIEIEVPTEE